jgi:hypothetical protein
VANLQVPDKYVEGFKKAEHVFVHQPIFSIEKMQMEPLHPLSTRLEFNSMDMTMYPFPLYISVLIEM